MPSLEQSINVMAFSSGFVFVKKLYMRARMELEDNPELTTAELRDLLINDLLKNTKSKLLKMILKHAIKKSLKEKKL